MAESDDSDESGFMESLSGVRKLKQDRVDLLQQKPRSKPRLQNRHQHPAGVADPGPSQAAESWFDPGIQQRLQRKIRQGQIPIDASLDLHGFRQLDAKRELQRFLQHALHNDARMLLIIHGKGFRSESEAVLRPLVQQWLQQQPMVLAYCPAQPRDGGYGASYAYLKQRQV
ncbi:MAG: Smr/MutS family protein [Gammaproteobacteria bacterium]|nr:Smr/MutS family protein [Gammaproteobacteria bacterium]